MKSMRITSVVAFCSHVGLLCKVDGITFRFNDVLMFFEDQNGTKYVQVVSKMFIVL